MRQTIRFLPKKSDLLRCAKMMLARTHAIITESAYIETEGWLDQVKSCPDAD